MSLRSCLNIRQKSFKVPSIRAIRVGEEQRFANRLSDEVDLGLHSASSWLIQSTKNRDLILSQLKVDGVINLLSD